MVTDTRSDQLRPEIQSDRSVAEFGDEVLAALRRVALHKSTDKSMYGELAELFWHLGWVQAQANEPLDDVVSALRTFMLLPSADASPSAPDRLPLRTIVFECLASLWRGYAAALQAAASETIEIVEAERRRLTQELHDETGQHLTACIFQLDHSLELAPPDGRLTGYLQQARKQLLHCSREVQRLSSHLSPRLLEEAGLVTTLEWFLTQFRDQYGLDVDARIADDVPDLPLVVATAVFRIVQEATTNVARHAHAQHVDVRLWRRDRTIHLVIVDDGIGLDEAASENGRRKGLGLRGMSARARQIGGRLTVTGRPNEGTRVELTFPVPRQPIPMHIRQGG